jgi:hypothetical protein
VRHTGRGISMALLAALAGMSAVPAAAGAARVEAQQSQDKQGVNLIAPAIPASFFGTRTQRSSRAAVSGCPWPGRRGACARRSSGVARRMR